MADVKVRGPVRTLWSKHGSVVIMIFACAMSFHAGREWQASESMDALAALLATQAEKQATLESKVTKLADQYSEIAQRLDNSSATLQKIIDRTKNGQKTPHQPKP